MTVKSSALLSTKIFAGRWRSDEGDLSSWQQSGKRAGRNKKMQATETFYGQKQTKIARYARKQQRTSLRYREGIGGGGRGSGRGGEEERRRRQEVEVRRRLGGLERGR